jgi:hypothetical protein
LPPTQQRRGSEWTPRSAGVVRILEKAWRQNGDTWSVGTSHGRSHDSRLLPETPQRSIHDQPTPNTRRHPAAGCRVRRVPAARGGRLRTDSGPRRNRRRPAAATTGRRRWTPWSSCRRTRDHGLCRLSSGVAGFDDSQAVQATAIRDADLESWRLAMRTDRVHRLTRTSESRGRSSRAFARRSGRGWPRRVHRVRDCRGRPYRR